MSEEQEVQSQPKSLAQEFADQLQERFAEQGVLTSVHRGQVTMQVPREHMLTVCEALRDEREFAFEQLIDLCGIDYSEYGKVEWTTNYSTSSGFSRGVHRDADNHEPRETHWTDGRFAVAYQLISYKHNRRLRLRTYADDDMPVVDSVVGTWNSANWFEREAYDLFGILFDGHPDLRRILTDYGFVGHPFRKDFPLIGQVEMRYDPEKKRVVYQPVSIEPRVTVPRVIRSEHLHGEQQDDSAVEG
jgi:NADH-quinone oxidoreductase subunit C